MCYTKTPSSKVKDWSGRQFKPGRGVNAVYGSSQIGTYGTVRTIYPGAHAVWKTVGGDRDISRVVNGYWAGQIQFTKGRREARINRDRLLKASDRHTTSCGRRRLARYRGTFLVTVRPILQQGKSRLSLNRRVSYNLARG